MKKALIDISRFLGVVYRIVTSFFINLFGVVRSFFILMLRTSKPRIFYGYAHFHYAKKYCDKRYKKYKGLDKLGRQQCCFPYRDEKLLVLSRLDLKVLQKKGLTGVDKDYKKIIKVSYYKTKL